MRLHFKEDENEDYMPIEEDADLLDDILVLVDEDLEVIEEDDLAEYGKDPNEENTIEEAEDISWANNNLLNKQEDKFATDMETMLKLDGYLLAKTPNNPILVFEGLNEQMKDQSLSDQIFTYALIRHSDFLGRSLCFFLNPLPTNKDVFYRRMYMEGELLI